MKFKIYTILIGILGISALAVAQPTLIEKVEAEEGKLLIPYEKYKLSNGLTVILHVDKSDPITHVDVTYHVGSSRETPGKSGFAHLFEHMLFQKSDHVAEDQYFKTLQEVGGRVNGNTEYDRTKYFETVPSNYLETALWLEADRMGFFLDAVTKESFEGQRKIVTNEKEQNQLNQPYGTVWEVKNQNMYPPEHPYSWPVIGYSDDLKRTTAEDLKNFYLRWYGPNNAVLTIAGDLDVPQTLKWVEKYFGGISQCPPVKKRMVPRVILPADKYVTIEDEIYLPLTLMSFPIAPQFHRDEAAIEVMSSIMGRGNNSIFYKNFVKTEKAVDATSAIVMQELSGEFIIQIVARPSESLEETEKLIRTTITEFETDVLNGAEIDEKIKIAKAVLKSETYDVMGSIQSKSQLLSEWEWKLGRKYNLQDWIDACEAVSKEDVMRVFNKYIKNKKAMIVNVVTRTPVEGEKEFVKQSFNPFADAKVPHDPQYDGLTYVKATDNFDRSVQPQPGAPKFAVIPESYTKTLPNDIKVIGTQTSEVPKVAFLISMKGRNLFEDGKTYQNGVASLTAELMNESTKNYTTEAISKELDKIGSEIYFWSDGESTNAFAVSMSDQVDKTLELLKEKLLNPAFTDEDFKRVKNQTLEGIKSDRTSPSSISSKAFRKIMYGNTPYGESASGTYNSIDKIKIDEVKSFYNSHYSADFASIVIVGDISESDAVAKVDFLKDWEKKNFSLPTFEKFPSYEGPQIMLIDKFGAQSIVTIGYMANKFDYKGTYFKSNVMNFALGGNFSSRININLRETNEFTYGARSSFRGGVVPGPFAVGTSVRTKATDSVVVEIMKEIKNYRENGITDEELKFTKSSLLLTDILNYETVRQKANFLARIIRYDLPVNYIAEQEEVIKGITKEEINALAREQLQMEKMVILIVGNGYVVKKPLEKLGYGKVKTIDAENINLKEFKVD